MLSTEEIRAYIQGGKSGSVRESLLSAEELAAAGHVPGRRSAEKDFGTLPRTLPPPDHRLASESTNIGLWIDHRKAVIVTLKGTGEDLVEIPSEMEKHVRYSGGAATAVDEDQRDRRYAGHLQKYYDMIIARIRAARAVLILGPGEAKVELNARLEREALGGIVAGVETVDKMTPGQLSAKVRDYFRAGSH